MTAWSQKSTWLWRRGALFGAVVMLASVLGLMEGIERWAYDVMFHLRGPIQPKSPIIIVSIGEDSFDELNLQWPWPRALHGQFLDIVSQGKPAAIGFDIVFPEPSSRGRKDDQALAEAIGRAGNVVLAAALAQTKGAHSIKHDLNAPIPIIRERAAAHGFVNFNQDEDAFVRSASLVRQFQGKKIASFDLQLYQLAVKAGLQAAPLPGKDSFLVNYQGGPQSFATIPYYQVLNGEIKPDVFAGAIVLLGATSPILHDVFPTPFATSGEMPGVEIHANMLETLFQGSWLRRSPLWVSIILTLAVCFLGVWITDRLRPLAALFAIVGLASGYAVAAHAAFLWTRLWLDIAPVPVALLLSYGATVVENFIKVQSETRRLSHYFSPDVVSEIIRQKDDASLASSRRRLTILFSDIRGFSAMSEKMSPEEVVTFLREYLTVMTDVVFQHGGTVDKYIGDAIMALYNVPFDQRDHAAQAVRTALAFQERLRPLAARILSKYGTDLRYGVGIHTGDAVVGTIGAEQRLEYTAIGDTINLASHLESITKDFKVSIIISESTHAEIKDQFLTRDLGEVKAKGREIPIRIYEVAEADLRKDERVAVKAAVDIVEDNARVHATVSELSESGLLVEHLPKEFEKGKILPLRLELFGGAQTVDVIAKVAWSREDKAGFTILYLKSDDRTIIERFIIQNR